MFPDVLKQCTRCREVKPTYDFHKKGDSRDKYSHYCAECSREASRLRRKRLPNDWRSRSGSVEVVARQMVRNRIHGGTLERGACEVCGVSKDIQAHHNDYSKPLEVRWLCRKHHVEYHYNLRNTPLDFDIATESPNMDITPSQIADTKTDTGDSK